MDAVTYTRVGESCNVEALGKQQPSVDARLVGVTALLSA